MEKKQNNSSEKNYEIKNIPDDYPNYDLNFKKVFIDDFGVGKSCLPTKAIKNTKNTFEDNFEPTIGFEFLTYILKVNNEIIKLQI